MEKKIRQLLRYLQIEYVAVWVLPLLLVALYETGVMTEGAYAGDVRMDYVLQTVGILLAVGLIPLSLRLFSLSLVKNVKQRSLPEALRSYRRWSEIRTGDAGGSRIGELVILLSDSEQHGRIVCHDGADRFPVLCPYPQADAG